MFSHPRPIVRISRGSVRSTSWKMPRAAGRLAPSTDPSEGHEYRSESPEQSEPEQQTTSDPVEEKKKVFDLSLTQVAGGALGRDDRRRARLDARRRRDHRGRRTGQRRRRRGRFALHASLRTGREKVRTVFRGQSTDAASAPPAPVDPRPPRPPSRRPRTALARWRRPRSFRHGTRFRSRSRPGTNVPEPPSRGSGRSRSAWPCSRSPPS